MPGSVERMWPGVPSAMGGRRARATFRYAAFLPDPIADIQPHVPFATASAVADAESAIRALNEGAEVRGLEAIGPLLLRSEAVASSRIEGYDVSPINLVRALIDPRAAKGSSRVVAANVSAMEEAVAIGTRGTPITIEDLLDIHRTLMTDDDRARPGMIRDEQNWIGGRLNNPSDAHYIPPPEDHVPALMADLVTFVNREDVPAVAQAAIGDAAKPVLSAPTARVAIEVSHQQTLAGLKDLAAAGVIRQISAGSYDRQFAATELFDLVSAYKEQLARPARERD